MSAQFTPGPWRWWATVSGARVAGHPADGSKNFVCDVLVPEKAVSYEANARLIAAAPDLLEALRELADDIADRFDMSSPSTNPGMKAAVNEARAAILKATGEPK